MDFNPLDFKKIEPNDLRPRMFHGKHGTHDDYISGELLAVRIANDALLFAARFAPGQDAASMLEQAGEPLHPDFCRGEAEFLIVRRKGRYFGRITRQAPERFFMEPQLAAGSEMYGLDAQGTGPGIGNRDATHFHLFHYAGRIRIDVLVNAYFGNGWFGAWKEIVIYLAPREYYVARP